MNGLERGCLVIADISGYTTYLTGVELEHSTDILADLIGVVVDNLCAFTLAKLEGDAVFCYAAQDAGDPHALVNTVESTYFGFMARQRNIASATSCPCDACRRIPTLNLKFVAHAGEWARHQVAGSTELVGPDVILVHRLLKNHVAEQTGRKGYALFSAACLERTGIDPAPLAMTEISEPFEGVGEVHGWVHDLEARWREEQERRAVYIAPAEGRIELSCDLPLPPPIVWELITAPQWRKMWMAQDVTEDPSARGVRGVGTTSHCVHGRVKTHHEVLDWKPFRYVTSKDTGPMGDFIATSELEPRPDGTTRVAFRTRPAGGRMQRLALKVGGTKMKAMYEESMEKLKGVAAEHGPALVAGGEPAEIS